MTDTEKYSVFEKTLLSIFKQVSSYMSQRELGELTICFQTIFYHQYLNETLIETSPDNEYGFTEQDPKDYVELLFAQLDCKLFSLIVQATLSNEDKIELSIREIREEKKFQPHVEYKLDEWRVLLTEVARRVEHYCESK